MENIVKQILESTDMVVCTRKVVDSQTHDENVELFQALCYAYMDLPVGDELEKNLDVVLDGMSGHSDESTKIGTSNYAW